MFLCLQAVSREEFDSCGLQDVVSSAIHEDLCGGPSAAAKIKSKLRQESEEWGQANGAKAQTGTEGALDISQRKAERFGDDGAASSLEGHHRSKSSSIASRVSPLGLYSSFFSLKDIKESNLILLRHCRS